MIDAPPIDDRRRFKELWKELLFARLVPPSAIVLVLGAASFWAGGMRTSFFLLWPPLILFTTSLMVSIGLVIAKRGWEAIAFSLAYMAALSAVAFLNRQLTPYYLGWDHQRFVVIIGVVAAGAGYAEGALERSIATTWVAWVVSSASAGAAALLVADYGAGFINPLLEHGFAVRLAVCPFIVELGIGLSLALGRWIRDLPKRKAAQAASDGEHPST